MRNVIDLPSDTEEYMKNLRRWIANKLARLARRIYPESEEVMAFHMDRMMDFVISGKSTVKIVSVDEGEPKGGNDS